MIGTKHLLQLLRYGILWDKFKVEMGTSQLVLCTDRLVSTKMARKMEEGHLQPELKYAANWDTLAVS